MALVRDPVNRAKDVRTPLQAARLYDDLEAELGLNPDIEGSDWEQKAEEALNILNDRFPDLDDVGRQGETGQDYVPKLSRRAGRALDEPSDQPHEGRTRRGNHLRARTPGGGARAGGRSASTPSRSARRITGKLTLGGPIGSATDTTLAGVRIMLALALVYLLLSARGSKAFAAILNVIGAGLRVFIGPGDPLAGGGPAPSTNTPTAAAGATRPHAAASAPARGAGGAGEFRGYLLGQRGPAAGLAPSFATGPRGAAYKRRNP